MTAESQGLNRNAARLGTGTPLTLMLYRWLLWLHPPAFRREFAGEMLWIFEEASTEGVAPLFADGLVSLLRQWLLRSGPWKLVAALVGGAIEVTAGGLGGILFRQAQMEARLASAQFAPPPHVVDGVALNNLVHIALWAATGVIVMVVVVVAWVRSLNAKRLHCLAAGPRTPRTPGSGRGPAVRAWQVR